jgi:chromosome segregation ATPase
MCFR